MGVKHVCDTSIPTQFTPIHWYGNVILMKLSSPAAPEVVIWQLPVQSVKKISSNWRHCRFSTCVVIIVIRYPYPSGLLHHHNTSYLGSHLRRWSKPEELEVNSPQESNTSYNIIERIQRKTKPWTQVHPNKYVLLWYVTGPPCPQSGYFIGTGANHTIARVPVKRFWRMWLKTSLESNRTC